MTIMKGPLDKLIEFVYDTLLFVLFMLFVVTLFVFASQWLLRRAYYDMGRVNAAPAPFPKRQKVVSEEQSVREFFYGMWRCKHWEEWKLTFIPGGRYNAIMGTSVWKGTWEVKHEDGVYLICIEEHPLHNPSHILKYKYQTTAFTRIYEVTD